MLGQQARLQNHDPGAKGTLSPITFSVCIREYAPVLASVCSTGNAAELHATGSSCRSHWPGRRFANSCTAAGKPRSTPTQLPQTCRGKEQLPLTGRPCVHLRRAEGCQDEAKLSGVISEKPLC